CARPRAPTGRTKPGSTLGPNRPVSCYVFIATLRAEKGTRRMPIAITTEHQDLADSVRALVKRTTPAEVLHAALETPVEIPPPFWRAAAEQGLHGLHLSESVGGQGFGLLELAVAV